MVFSAARDGNLRRLKVIYISFESLFALILLDYMTLADPNSNCTVLSASVVSASAYFKLASYFLIIF